MKEKESMGRIFQGKKIRTYWDEEKEEGSELSDKIGQLKMIAEDGKMREKRLKI